jgi:hypothetical protein
MLLLAVLALPVSGRAQTAGETALLRDWRLTTFDAAGEVLQSRRVDLPVAVEDAAAQRLRLERRMDTGAGTWPVLHVTGAWQLVAGRVDGQRFAHGGDGATVWPLAPTGAAPSALDVTLEFERGAAATVGLWGEVRLEQLPRVGLARAHEAAVGPLARWTWLDPSTPELVVRAELLSRDGDERSLDLAARLRNTAGLELAAELSTGLRTGPLARIADTLRLRPRSFGADARFGQAPPRLELVVLEAGVEVDRLELDVPVARIEVEGGRFLDRAGGVEVPLFVHRAWLPGAGEALPPGAHARDARRALEAGLRAVSPRSSFGDLDASGVAAFGRTFVAGGGQVFGGDGDSTSAVVGATRAAGERALAEQAAAVARALAAGRGGIELADSPGRDSGSLDRFRRPKFAWHALRAAMGLPGVYPATFWNAERFRGPLDVYTSGDGVELFVDGRSLGRRAVGEAGAPPFAARFEDVERGVGELRAVAYRGARVVAERRLAAPASASRLLISADLLGVERSVPDVVVVHALALDAQGDFQAGFEGEVRFTLFGGAEALTPATVRAEAGVASLVLRINGEEPATVAAQADGLASTPIVL